MRTYTITVETVNGTREYTVNVKRAKYSKSDAMNVVSDMVGYGNVVRFVSIVRQA